MDAVISKEERLAILEDCGVIDVEKQEFFHPFRDDEGADDQQRPSRTASSSSRHRSVPGAHAISGPAHSSDDDSSSVDSVSSADHRRRYRHQEQEENRQIVTEQRRQQQQQQQQPSPELFALEMVQAYAVEDEDDPMIISVHAKPYHGARRMRRCMVVLTLLLLSATTALLVLVLKLSRRKEEADKQELLEDHGATDDAEWFEDLP